MDEQNGMPPLRTFVVRQEDRRTGEEREITILAHQVQYGDSGILAFFSGEVVLDPQGQPITLMRLRRALNSSEWFDVEEKVEVAAPPPVLFH